MIRKYCDEDKKRILDIVRQGILTDDEELDFITENSNEIIVFDDETNGILGFSTFRVWGENHNKADVYTYVVPSSRRKGIGTLLYDEITKNIKDNSAQAGNFVFFSTRMKVEKDDPTSFYEKRGYQKWYAEYDMQFDGSEQPASYLLFVPYEEKYFTQYVDGLRTSFYELRKTNDFQPYFCCEWNEEKRKELLDAKDSLFLLFDNETLIASVIVRKNGIIDDVFVVPSYQGKGYGKKLMQFSINKAIDRGNSCISLRAIEWNSKALNLYQSVGLDVVQTTNYYRLFG